MRRSWAIRVLLLAAAVLPAPVLVAADTGASSCVSCHSALDERNSEPVRLWKRDLHKDAGISCHHCHGGDPLSLESAMTSSSGFIGAPGPEAAVRICGGCHSDNARIPDPTMATGQLEQYLSGPHGSALKGNRPTCVTCHGSHGIYRITDRSSPVFPTHIASLCITCHDEDSTVEKNGPRQYLDDVHGRALAHATNPHAPACTGCHGAHRAAVPSAAGVQMVCGNCHTLEYEYFQSGPHGTSLQQFGEPSCTHCHGFHGIKASGIDEIVGRITDNCQGCHQPGSRALFVGSEIDERLGVAMSLLDSLEGMSEEFRLSGIETSEMNRLIKEAYGWLLQVESAIHSSRSDWEELTGMAKVKMMAAWDMARDYNLEKGLRRIILLFVALLAISIFALLAYKLKLSEKDQLRRHILGSPEARQREQEHQHK